MENPTSNPWWRVQWRWAEPELSHGEAVQRLELRSRQQRQLASLRMAILWLTLLATLGTFYVARSLVVPVLFAAFIALSLNPIVNGLARRWFPRSVVAALVTAAGIMLMVLLVAWVAEPAQHWFENAPGAVRSLAPKLRAMTQQIEAASRATQSIITLGVQAPHSTATPAMPALFDIWEALSATPRMLASVFAVVLLAYFFLVYGDTLLRKTVTLAPSLQQKRNAVDILRTMQREMSRYLFTTTLINGCVGLGAAIIAYALGIGDPMLWGMLAALLNFIPYVGPMTMTGVFIVLGLLGFEKIGLALTPAGLFALLVILEGQFLTPLILGRRLHLNPVVILLALMLLGWLWGPAGIVLAVPSLVALKIICQRVEGWDRIAQAIE